MRLAFIRLLLVLLPLLAAPAAFAQYSEAEVKAAFVFNVAKFAEWPAEVLPAGAPLRVCVLGKPGDFSGALATLDGRQVQGRTLAVSSGAASRPCHMLVLIGDASDPNRATVAETGTLTIAESLAFVDSGGMLGMGIVDNRVRFSVNVQAVRRAGIRLPAQFLRLATLVRDQ